METAEKEKKKYKIDCTEKNGMGILRFVSYLERNTECDESNSWGRAETERQKQNIGETSKEERATDNRQRDKRKEKNEASLS